MMPPTAIDLYCGSGAVTEGLTAEGIRVVAAVDNDAIACQTYRLNHPEVYLCEEDIRNVAPCTIREHTNFVGNLDLLVVCAPCQPFSSQNRKRGNNDDDRTTLVLECLKFVQEFNPGAIIFENVPGIAILGPLSCLRQRLFELGYILSEPRTLNAADCGVPQRRERCVMIAAKTQEGIDTFYQSITPQPRITVRQMIGGLRPLNAAERDPDDPLHFARDHQSIVLQRLAYIPRDGGSRHALPPELELECHKGRTKDFSDVYGRMCWDDVAPTLTTGCTDVTKGRFAHPRDNRAITLREAALLQSFPPQYRFHGNSGQIARQIGNAVPVNMIRTLVYPLLQLLQTQRQ